MYCGFEHSTLEWQLLLTGHYALRISRAIRALALTCCVPTPNIQPQCRNFAGRAHVAGTGALKIVLILLGSLFTAGIYPLIGSLLHPADSDTGDAMMLSLYVALGIFVLTAVRNPSAHRSLIAFAAWCRGDVDTGTRTPVPTSRISGRVGCARCSLRGPKVANARSCEPHLVLCVGNVTGTALSQEPSPAGH